MENLACLISDEDLNEIHGDGVPYMDRDDLFVQLDSESIALTIKGYRIFRYALEYWGVRKSLCEINTESQLYSLVCEIKQACVLRWVSWAKEEGLSASDAELIAEAKEKGLLKRQLPSSGNVVFLVERKS